MFPRITDREVIDGQRIAELISVTWHTIKGIAITAKNDLAEVMAELLKEGKTIDIPMLGSFKLSIGTDMKIYPNSNRRMQSIEVRGVSFHPDRLSGLKRTTAYSRLKELVENGLIQAAENGSETKYVKI